MTACELTIEKDYAFQSLLNLKIQERKMGDSVGLLNGYLQCTNRLTDVRRGLGAQRRLKAEANDTFHETDS